MKADLVYREVLPPVGNYCSSGHTAPETFPRDGEDKPAVTTKFFHVAGQNIDIVVCEPCLIVANYMAQQMKEQEKGR